MAARRTTRLAGARGAANAQQPNENDLSVKTGATAGAPKAAAGKAALATRSGLAPKATLGVKSANLGSNVSVVIPSRKRTILHETTNGGASKTASTSTLNPPRAGPSTSGTKVASAAGSSAAAPRRYGTRSSTGGSADVPRMDRQVESEDAVMEDMHEDPAEPEADPEPKQERVIKPIRKTAMSQIATTSHRQSTKLAPNSTVLIRQRRIAAEELAARAAEELEEAKRAEEEHKSKKLRTSEPDFAYDHEEDDDEAEVEEDEELALERPKDHGWEDLDEGDEEDPLMVSEYVVEVYEYLKELEKKTMPNPEYMQEQVDVTWKMRGILVDYLVEVHTRFRLLPETIFLAINIVDRMLSVNVVAMEKLQLVGITALFVASKYEEVTCPSVQNFHYVTDKGYDDDEILRAERYILGMLDFNLSYPNPINFLRRISKADGYDIQSRTMAKYLMEISIVDYRFLATPPSLIAAAGSWLARRVLNKGAWNANLVHYSGYTEDELKPTAQLMLDYIVRNSSLANPNAKAVNPLRPSETQEEGPEHPNFIKKYANKKFFKASISVRKWAESTYAPVDRRNPATRKMERVVTPATL